MLFGLAHLGGFVSSRDAPPQNERERQLQELLYGYKENLMGTLRSQGEIFDGFSLSISIFTMGAGLVALTIARSSDARLLFSVAIAECGWLGAMLGVSLRYWFAAPTLFLAVSFVCFLAGAIRLKTVTAQNA